jgi:hypothetical protein
MILLQTDCKYNNYSCDNYYIQPLIFILFLKMVIVKSSNAKIRFMPKKISTKIFV